MNTKFKFNPLVKILTICTVLLSVGCQGDEVSPSGDIDISDTVDLFNGDTTVSCMSQILYIPLNGNLILDGQAAKEKLSELISRGNYRVKVNTTVGVAMEGTSARIYTSDDNTGWISSSVVRVDDGYALKVDLDENKSNSELRVANVDIEIGSGGNQGEKCLLHGQMEISQWPSKDPIHKIKIVYNGKLLESEIKLSWDDRIEYLNPEVQKIFDTISLSKDVDYVVEGDVVRIIDENDSDGKLRINRMLKGIGSGRKYAGGLVSTRSTEDPFEGNYGLGMAALYNHDSFRDGSIQHALSSTDEVSYVTNMIDIGLNDKITSIAVKYTGDAENMCAVLTVWEDSNFNEGDNDRTKHRVSFIASKYNPEVKWATLKDLSCIGSHNSWNDRISSYAFYMGNYENRWIDY